MFREELSSINKTSKIQVYLCSKTWIRFKKALESPEVAFKWKKKRFKIYSSVWDLRFYKQIYRHRETPTKASNSYIYLNFIIFNYIYLLIYLNSHTSFQRLVQLRMGLPTLSLNLIFRTKLYRAIGKWHLRQFTLVRSMSRCYHIH